MSGFVHLHVHSEYSLLDGACRVKQLVKRAKELGQTAIAVTDHGNMYGAVEFYNAAREAGVKPILGCEVYVAKRSRFDKVHGVDNEIFHLVLLCENNTGYQNLIKLVSQGWIEGFYNKPRIDHELLKGHTEGLIALSACLAGEIPRLICDDKYEEARALAIEYRELFGENNYFLELQDHGIEEQKRVNDAVLRISNETGIPVVVTNDAHYVNKDDARMHAILLCIQTKDNINNPDAFKFPTDEFYVKSEEEMARLVPGCEEAVENTVKIAERCNVELEFGNIKVPNFDVPDGGSHYDYFEKKCREGLARRYGENPSPELTQRLDYELDVIKTMGYVDYYLIVNDYIEYARSQDIPVGPGRGSGAGSIAAYCLGITSIDPIRYNLLFERFLNPERVSMPDFDVDFCTERRGEVIDYVRRKYGDDHVAMIVAIGTMQAKNAIRDTARAMGLPYSLADRIAKLVPNELNITLEDSLKKSAELRGVYDSDPQVHELIDMALRVEGMPRNTTKHAAGVVITVAPVSDYVPLAVSEGDVVTQYTMGTLERLGLLKMDFLGLRNLTVIDDCEKMIGSREPGFSVDNISLEDSGVYAMMAEGSTSGVFQFESEGMRRLLMQITPVSLEDLIAVISLYRPGPMDSIPKYVKNRQHPEGISYDTPMLADILDVTNGCVVYQEQVMQICRALAGFSYGRADVVRKAMSKKKLDVMEKERDVFINGALNEDGSIAVEGCVRRGVDKKTANKLFDDMTSFASYAFNKSHAACYAVVAYQTAYLKYYYPCEYFAALLTSVQDNRGKLAEYTAECHRLDIEVLPPHVNSSEKKFTVEGGNIRFGLLAIKNLGAGVIEQIIESRREDGEYSSFFNFCKRVSGRDVNKRAIESLIKSGALDGLADNRRQMLVGLEDVMAVVDSDKNAMEGQLGLFALLDEPEDSGVALPKLEEFKTGELLAMEKEVTEMYLSGHPLKGYEQLAAKLGATRISSFAEQDERDAGLDGKSVTLVCIINSIKLKSTKNNDTMAFVQIEDMTGSAEMIVFPRVLDDFAALLKPEKICRIGGRISMREEEEPKIICESVMEPMEGKAPQYSKRRETGAAGGFDSRTPPPERERYYDEAPPLEPAQSKENESASLQSKQGGTKRKGLYIKCKSLSCESLEKAKKVLRIFDGKVPVYVYSLETSQLMCAPQELWIAPNGVMLAELGRILGESNIKLVE